MMFRVFAALVLFVSAHAQAQTSMLRVACDGDAEGANVSVNGQFKGQCPVDMSLSAGTIALRVDKKLGTSHEGVFEREVRIGDGVVQRINVVLVRKLTEEGRAAAQARNEAATKAYNSAKFEYDWNVKQREVQVEQCARESVTAAHGRMMDCFTNSGGCVGPFGCEDPAKRRQRCSSNGKGFFQESEFIAPCRARMAALVPPTPPKLETD